MTSCSVRALSRAGNLLCDVYTAVDADFSQIAAARCSGGVVVFKHQSGIKVGDIHGIHATSLKLVGDGSLLVGSREGVSVWMFDGGRATLQHKLSCDSGDITVLSASPGWVFAAFADCDEDGRPAG